MVRSLLQERTPAPRFTSAGPTLPPTEFPASLLSDPPPAGAPDTPTQAPPPLTAPKLPTAAPATSPGIPVASAAPRAPTPEPARPASARTPSHATPSDTTPSNTTPSDTTPASAAPPETPAEPTANGLGAAEPTGSFLDDLADLGGLEPQPAAPAKSNDFAPAAQRPAAAAQPSASTSDRAAAHPAARDADPRGPGDDAPPDALPLILDEHAFSDAGENTNNWQPRRTVTIDDLLGGSAPDGDATVVGASPLAAPPGSDELSTWAANALGFDEEAIARPPSRPAAPPRLPTSEEPLPTLREPRVGGANAASVDVRGAARGAAPRIAGLETIEVAEPTGEFPAPAPETGEEPIVPSGGGFQVTFERSAPARPAPTAPRLTEDDELGDDTNITSMPTREPFKVDDAQIQQFLDEAQAHARRGDLQKSIQSFTDALDMRPTLVEAHIGRGRCHLELGDYSSAMSDFARAEDLAPDRPDAHVATGDLYFARKEYKRAIEFYDQAVELDGSHAMARCRRGISHYYRKNYRQAFQDLQRALALDPEIPNIRKYVQMAQKKLDRGD